MTARDWADQDAAAIYRELKQMQLTRTGSPQEMLARCLRFAEERGYERGRSDPKLITLRYKQKPTALDVGLHAEPEHRAQGGRDE